MATEKPLKPLEDVVNSLGLRPLVDKLLSLSPEDRAKRLKLYANIDEAAEEWRKDPSRFARLKREEEERKSNNEGK